MGDYDGSPMVGTTLTEIRAHIERLASGDGEYYLRCGRTGERPVPVSGLRFERRATARKAVRAAEQYRTALRRYDPQVPYCDLIVCQRTTPGAAGSRPESGSGERSRPDSRDPTTPAGHAGSGRPERRELVEFCHTAAAAVFETLTDQGYDAVETAVMDAYLEPAETRADPDELCLCLLEGMAGELADRLPSAEQAEVLASAAARLPSAEATDRPVARALSVLESSGLLGDYTWSPWSMALEEGTRSVVIRLSEYALAPRNGRLPVVPLVLELHRHRRDWFPASLRAVGTDHGWRLTLVLAREADPIGLASAPIDLRP